MISWPQRNPDPVPIRDRIAAIDAMRNPDKPTAVREPGSPAAAPGTAPRRAGPLG